MPRLGVARSKQAPSPLAQPVAQLIQNLVERRDHEQRAFFTTMPISRITPIRLMMLSVLLVTQSASTTP